MPYRTKAKHFHIVYVELTSNSLGYQKLYEVTNGKVNPLRCCSTRWHKGNTYEYKTPIKSQL